MALDLHLEDRQVEVLAFILDDTIQRWKVEGPDQMTLMAADPTYQTPEELIEATGYLNDLLQRAIALRSLMDLPAVS
jgi:hypothetical protein